MNTSPDTHTADPTARYAYSNYTPAAAVHLGSLAALFDPRSLDWLRRSLPHPDWLHGAHCLELAAGAGGFAHLLAELTGDGTVLATDLDPQHIPTGDRRVQVLRHDLNDPLPEGLWDLTHARLILGHLPHRRVIVTRMAQATRAGGLVVVEDLLPTPAEHIVADAPTDEIAELIRRVQQAHRLVLNQHGNSPTWAWEAHEAMTDAGLIDVRHEVWGQHWTGGGAGCQFLAACYAQLVPQLAATGLVDQPDCHRVIRTLREDPGVVLNGHQLALFSGVKQDRAAA